MYTVRMIMISNFWEQFSKLIVVKNRIKHASSFCKFKNQSKRPKSASSLTFCMIKDCGRSLADLLEDPLSLFRSSCRSRDPRRSRSRSRDPRRSRSRSPDLRRSRSRSRSRRSSWRSRRSSLRSARRSRLLSRWLFWWKKKEILAKTIINRHDVFKVTNLDSFEIVLVVEDLDVPSSRLAPPSVAPGDGCGDVGQIRSSSSSNFRMSGISSLSPIWETKYQNKSSACVILIFLLFPVLYLIYFNIFLHLSSSSES